MLAVSQLFRRYREGIVADDLRRTAIESDFDLRNFRLSAGIHFDIPGRLQDRLGYDAAEFHGRRQRGNFELQRLDDFRASRIDRAQRNRICPGRQIGGIQGELHPVVFHNNSHARVGAYGRDG